MCKIKYDRVLDVIQILEKDYTSKEVEFYQLYKGTPDLYLITKNDRVIGLECVAFKETVEHIYRTKRYEYGFKRKIDAQEFVKGWLYNMFKTEFVNGKVKEETRMDKIMFIEPKTIRSNLRELCPA